MANPFIPKPSHVTFKKEADQFLKKITLSDFDSLDERDQYNAHRLKTIANSIYARGRGEHAIVYDPSSSRYMTEVEGMGSQRFYNICKYLESLRFWGPYEKAFSNWINQLETWHNSYEQMERGEHELQKWMPEEMKRKDMEEKKVEKELIGKCIGQLKNSLSIAGMLDLEENPYVFYGHEHLGGITMSKESHLGDSLVLRFFFDTMLNKDYYFSSSSPDGGMMKAMDEFDVGLGNLGFGRIRVKEPETIVWPYVVMYHGLEFEPYVHLTPEELLAICDENGFDYRKLELGEGKSFSWPEHKFNKDAEELYKNDPEVQKMDEEIIKSY